MYDVEIEVGYRAAERCAVWRHRLHRDPIGRIPVVFAHGVLGSHLTGLDPQFDDTLRWLAHAGYPVLAPDLNGAGPFGNQGFLDAIDQAVAWSAAEYGTRTDKVGIVGQSMGGLALTWCHQNPGRLAAAVFHLPVAQLAAFRVRNPVGLGGAVESAYGGTAGYNAALPVHDPMQNTAAFAPIADRIRIWYSTTDTVVIPAEVTGFATAAGIDAISIGAQGHTLGTWDQREGVHWMRSVMDRWP